MQSMKRFREHDTSCAVDIARDSDSGCSAPPLMVYKGWPWLRRKNPSPESLRRNEIYYSNRSAANAALKRWDEALRDGRRAVQLKPGWAKGFARLGAAFLGLDLWSEVGTLSSTRLSPRRNLRLPTIIDNLSPASSTASSCSCYVSNGLARV
jgi:stress-induced-phosphoprotein 1